MIDDGSIDNTSDIKNDFPSVEYIYKENSGASGARNKGIEHASFEWIAFLDSDDEWLPTKLEEQVAFHQVYNDILMSYTDEYWVRDGVNVKIPKKFKKIGKDAFVENLSYCNIAPSSVLIHKTLFKSIGMFDETLEVCEDYDLWLRISLEEKIALVDKKLITKYAGHEDQLSCKHWGMDRFRIITLEKLLMKEKSLITTNSALIEKELLKKYIYLLKGAIKHEKREDIRIYEEKIAKFRLV